MNSKLFPITVASVLSAFAWGLGAKVGAMTGYFAGVLGFGLGMYVGRRIMDEYFE